MVRILRILSNNQILTPMKLIRFRKGNKTATMRVDMREILIHLFQRRNIPVGGD